MLHPLHGAESGRFFTILPLVHTYDNILGPLLPPTFRHLLFLLDRLPTHILLVPDMHMIKPTIILSVPLVIILLYATHILPKFSCNRW